MQYVTSTERPICCSFSEGLTFLWSNFIQEVMFSRFAIFLELITQLLSVLIHLLGGFMGTVQHHTY
jgi:hypothetical protein